MQELIKKLKSRTPNYEDKCIDLKSLKFESKEGEMWLYDDISSYYFKSDPENPKDPKVTHAAQQFCKLMKVPYSFFAKNPEYMKNEMASCWLPSLKSEKAIILAKLKKSSTHPIFRALLPIEYTNISNVEILECISEAIKDDFTLEFVIGDDKDDLILHIRFIMNEQFEAYGETCAAGFSVVASELGASPLIVDTFLYRVPSKSSFIASYNNENFFKFDYENVQPNDVKNVFPLLVDRLKGQLIDLKDKIQSAKEQNEKKEDIKDLLFSLKLKKGLSEKFHTLLYQEIENDPNVKNRWDFAHKVAILAKDFDVTKRVRIEKIAGELIGLYFEKT